MNGRAMSKSLGNLVNLQEQIATYGPDAVRVAMVFAGPAEDSIDWADVAPIGAVKWLARVRHLASQVGAADAPVRADAPLMLRQAVHRLIADTTRQMDDRRLNVAIARLMELTSVLRRSVEDERAGDPAVREGAEALVRMLSCFAPFTAEEAWQRLGRDVSVSDQGWPLADEQLLADRAVTCVIQVDGKVRDRIEVVSTADERMLQRLALSSAKVRQALGDASVARVVVRPPTLVNIVSSAAG